MKITVNAGEELDAVMENQLQNNEEILVVVLAAYKPNTTVSWCGDCVSAIPVINKACAEMWAHKPVITCWVARDVYKNNPEYVLRIHPVLKLEALPQVYRIRRDGKIQSLVEGDCSDHEKVQSILK